MTIARADSHLHLFEHGFVGRNGQSPIGDVPDISAYETLRREHNIAAGLVVGYEPTGDAHYTGNNGYLRKLAGEHSWIHSVAYIETSARPDISHIERTLAQGHVGLAIYLADVDSVLRFRSWPAEIWAMLNAHRAIVSLNIRPEPTAHLQPIVDALADCCIMVSHIGLPGPYGEAPTRAAAEERLSGLLALSGQANVRVKLSGLYAVGAATATHPHPGAAPFLDAVLEKFGAYRCLWGSDFTPSLDWCRFEDTFRLPVLDQLNSDEREAIVGGNLLSCISGRR